jgi:predicted aspartyl protease
VHIPRTLAILMLFAADSVASASPSTTPFDLLEDGSIVVLATVGGSGPYRFVLDTGSSRTVITTALWKALKAPVIAKTPMVTPAGRHMAYVVSLRSLAIAGGPGASVSAAVMDADRYAAGQPIDGLIGQDLLSTIAYTIEFDRRVVVWHSTGEMPAGLRLPLNVRDNRLLVSVDQNRSDSRPLWLIPDSGSDGVVLFAHARDKVRLTMLDFGVLSSMSGTRLAQRVRVEDLVVGDTRLENLTAALVDAGDAGGLMGDGLLPLHIFSRVTFNVNERYLIVHR